MHRDVCMHEINRKGRKNHLKVVAPVVVCPRNAAQSNVRGIRWNPPETSKIQPTRMMYIFMIFIKSFTLSNFQIFKIISESNLSRPLSQNGMIDLDSGNTGTNTDSGKRLKSSKYSGVKIGSGSGSKSRSWNSSPHSFSHDGMWLSKIGDSSSRMTGMGIKTDSKMLLKLGNKTGVNIGLES